MDDNKKVFIFFYLINICFLFRRRWQILLIETLFAGVFFVTSVFIAKPVFLTPITDAPGAALTGNAILSALQKRTIVGYAPNTNPYDKVMKRAADLLRISKCC